MVPLIQAENAFELTKQLQPFARVKDPLYLHSLGYNSYTVHNGTEDWNKNCICHISTPNIFPLKKKTKQNKPQTKIHHIWNLEHEEGKNMVKTLLKNTLETRLKKAETWVKFGQR